MTNSNTPQAHYKTLWLSDIHLGSKDCKAEYLLEFLNHTKMDTLYLVGDIVDMWAMSKQFRWPEAHNQVLHKILSLSREQTEVIYLPGNHDAPLQKYSGMQFDSIQVVREHVHITSKGKKLLVLHGDQFDQEVCFGALHLWIGDKAYDLLLFINRWYNRIRKVLGFPYWSLAGYIKSRINGANKAIERYKQACCSHAKKLGLDGVVCGHIHHPEIDCLDDVQYYNDGDWIENCSALSEAKNGEIKLIYWTKTQMDNNMFELKHAKTKLRKKAA